MNVYIYAADLFCGDCGRAIKERLTAEGQAPANPDDERSYDSDAFPKGPYGDGGGESDTPGHCGGAEDCSNRIYLGLHPDGDLMYGGCSLENDLTEHGVQYVLESLAEATERTPCLDGWRTDLDAYDPGDAGEPVLDRYDGLPYARDFHEPQDDKFTRQYIVTALWSSTDGPDSIPMDQDHGPSDLARETWNKMAVDCARFQAHHGYMFADDPETAGHDFWLTRNGHGAGFWDGDYPQHGDALTAACKTYRECDLYVGDDQKIYIA